MTQANRTLVTLAALLVLGGGVALYAFYGIFETDRKDTEKKDKDDRLFMPVAAGEKKADGGFADAEFVKLTVTARGDTTVLERKAGEPWRITSPVRAAAEKVGVDALVSQLQQSKFKHVIEESPTPEQVKKFGLDKPDFTVEAVAEVGPNREQRTVKLEGGVENTYDGTIYMRRNGEPRVLAAQGGVKWTMAKSTLELREKDVLGIDEGKVLRAEVEGKNNAYVLTADDKRAWKVEARRWAGMKAGAEATFDGDPVAINGALGALKNERATAFPPDTPEARQAFEHPTLQAQFTLAGDAGVKVKLVQTQLPDGGSTARILAEHGGQVTLAEVPGTHLAQLDRLPTDFRDKRIMPFKKEEVAKIIFYTATGAEIVAEKASPDAGTADSWRIVSPRQGPAKTLKIASLLWSLGALKAQKVVEEAPKDTTKYGLDIRVRAVSIYDPAGKPLGHLEWGNAVPNGNPGVTYMRGTRGDVVEGEAGRLTDWPKAVEDLLDLPAADAGSAADAGK